MVLIRQPAVAGTFYPANPEVLQKMINTFLDAIQSITKVPSVDKRKKNLLDEVSLSG